MNPQELRWNGWGALDRERPLSQAERRWLTGILGVSDLPSTPAPDLDAIILPESRLDAAALGSLERAVEVGIVCTDRRDRAYHALGQSYHDLLRYRSGRIDAAPDAVVYPESEADVAAVLTWSMAHDAALVPFGGGSSVVGGVTAHGSDRFSHVVTIDMSRMNGLLSLDEVDRLATFEAGVDGPSLEHALGARGFTLGHFPQSFEYSTLGGWIAARGAGQQSNRYGAADRWLAAARLATPAGTWNTEPFPASGAGPRLGDFVVGSEGTLGIITRATVHLHRLPETRWERGFLFRDFASGLAAVRELSQRDLACGMVRLSDPDETRFQSSFASLGKRRSLAERAFRWLLARRGFADRPALLLVGIEGEKHRVRRDAAVAARTIGRAGGLSLGPTPGRKWRETRFDAPFLRDPLLDVGLGVDTLETATRWGNVARLYRAVRQAIEEAVGPGGVVMAHLSHTYADGASLYFTMVFMRDPGDPIAQWRRIKVAASDAIIAAGGTISHHHGVGEDHGPWLAGDKGPIGLQALDAARRALDPDGRLNPGKLSTGPGA